MRRSCPRHECRSAALAASHKKVSKIAPIWLIEPKKNFVIAFQLFSLRQNTRLAKQARVADPTNPTGMSNCAARDRYGVDIGGPKTRGSSVRSAATAKSLRHRGSRGGRGDVVKTNILPRAQ